MLENFNNCVFKDLASIVSIKNLLEFKKTPYKKLCYSVLPFCVWNHIFLCCRSQYESIMCLFCTKLHLRNKKIRKTIKKKLAIDVYGHFPFPVTLHFGVRTGGFL